MTQTTGNLRWPRQTRSRTRTSIHHAEWGGSGRLPGLQLPRAGEQSEGVWVAQGPQAGACGWRLERRVGSSRWQRGEAYQ